MWHYAPLFARKPEPTIRELDHLAECVLRKVRNREGVVWPGHPVGASATGERDGRRQGVVRDDGRSGYREGGLQVVNDPKTVAEQLDAAKDGEEFGQVLMGFFSALAKQREDDE
jgi:alkanesulfonate monooxygenase SsuD/methylene tetrahydromethanopterin reductase-like flavin-dependent oxidoreductase (luciferase family)